MPADVEQIGTVLLLTMSTALMNGGACQQKASIKPLLLFAYETLNHSLEMLPPFFSNLLQHVKEPFI